MVYSVKLVHELLLSEPSPAQLLCGECILCYIGLEAYSQNPVVTVKLCVMSTVRILGGMCVGTVIVSAVTTQCCLVSSGL